MPKKATKHHESSVMRTDEWLTPPSIIRSLGEFDLDPCSPINRPWDTAKQHYTVNDNGLLLPWFGRGMDEPALWKYYDYLVKENSTSW